MVERKYTLVEYHSHGAGPSFFPDIGTVTEEADEIVDDESKSSTGLAVFIALVLLIGVAVGIRYFMKDNDEPDASPDTDPVEITEYEN